MMDSFRQQSFYFYSKKPLLRLLMKHAYRFLSAHDLHEIDAEAQERREVARTRGQRCDSRGL